MPHEVFELLDERVVEALRLGLAQGARVGYFRDEVIEAVEHGCCVSRRSWRLAASMAQRLISRLRLQVLLRVARCWAGAAR